VEVYGFGKLIVFEGIDGCGKTTQANILLDSLYPNISLFGELYTTDVGIGVRGILERGDHISPKEEALLFAAARWSMCNRFICNLVEGETVVCDRYRASAVAYSVYGRGVDRSFIDSLLPSITPSLTIFIDIPVSEAEKRLAHRGPDHLVNLDRLEKVRQGYLSEYYDAVARGERWIQLDGLLDRTSLSFLILKEVKEVLSVPTAVSL